MEELTQELVRNLFNYKDGFLYWKKINIKNQVKIGNKAGNLNPNGYYNIRINNKLYKAHRLIFLYHKGFLPKMIDHIDRDSTNNYIENLREITNSQNHMNCKKLENYSSKYKGIHWHKKNQKWIARIKINGNRIYLGSFKSERAAAFIYNVYARGLFGKYAYLNNLGE